MDTTHDVALMVEGSVQVRHIGGFGFPIEELVADHARIVALGRDSSLNIFFGRGRRAQLADGTEWRIAAANVGRHIVPVIRADSGTVAYAGPLDGKRTYGITGKDFAYTLVPLGRVGFRRTAQWGLRLHEREVAFIDNRRRMIRLVEPIPLAAVLLCFTLVEHGIPGEADLLPRRL